MSASQHATDLSKQPAPEHAAGGGSAPKWLKWWLAGLSLMLVSFWAFPAVLLLRGATTPADAALPPEEPSAASEPFEILEGPFGRLQLVPIVISPPEEVLQPVDEILASELVWKFGNTSRSELNELLISLGLPEALMAELRSSVEMDPAINGFTIRPSPELVIGLEPDIRARIYRVLHGHYGNEQWLSRFCYTGESVEDWLDDAPLMSETRRLVSPLVYRNGGVLFFSDLPAVEPMLPSLAERDALVKAFSRESTYLVNLEISADSDIEALVRYWGRGGREKDVRPLIESLAESGNRQHLDITHLLPVFARNRVYTYPDAAESIAQRRDCHWTALNFFAEQPDDRFCKPNSLPGELAADYYPINGNLQLGDLILYVDPKDGKQSRAVHTAVYIAGDLLLTKNGASPIRPWMFMKRESMDDFYPRANVLSVHYFRRKGI